MKITALAGGVGGAKLVDGLAQILAGDQLSAIVNTGDDFEHFGLYISPDVDTVCYTLAGLSNPNTGWGRVDESWQVITEIERLGGPGWFHLGDRDLATHLERTRRMRAGQPLSAITRDFCAAWGVRTRVLPMSDQHIPTIVQTVAEGDLPFQEYFVARRCEPVVRGFRFEGVESAHPAPGVLEALAEADAIIIAPSNPWVSIAPILALPGVLAAVQGKKVVAVSPIIGGKALKGPAAKMFSELGIAPSAKAVAHQYQSFLKGFLLDPGDENDAPEIERWGIIPYITNVVMTEPADRRRLADEALTLISRL